MHAVRDSLLLLLLLLRQNAHPHTQPIAFALFIITFGIPSTYEVSGSNCSYRYIQRRLRMSLSGLAGID